MSVTVEDLETVLLHAKQSNIDLSQATIKIKYILANGYEIVEDFETIELAVDVPEKTVVYLILKDRTK